MKFGISSHTAVPGLPNNAAAAALNAHRKGSGHSLTKLLSPGERSPNLLSFSSHSPKTLILPFSTHPSFSPPTKLRPSTEFFATVRKHLLQRRRMNHAPRGRTHSLFLSIMLVVASSVISFDSSLEFLSSPTLLSSPRCPDHVTSGRSLFSKFDSINSLTSKAPVECLFRSGVCRKGSSLTGGRGARRAGEGCFNPLKENIPPHIPPHTHTQTLCETQLAPICEV